MYLHLGGNVIVSSSDVVMIMEWTPEAKENNRINQLFLLAVEENGQIIDVSAGRPKSIVILKQDKVYLSSISKQTLRKRCSLKVFTGG